VKETELYGPVKAYLQEHGYVVHGEVKNCDVTGTRGEELVVVELKTGANMKLLVQATDRQRITDSVYVAIPAPKSQRGSHWRGVKRVLRMLELGLLIVHFGKAGARVEQVFGPEPYQRQKRKARRRAVIQELARRTGDHNVGGSTGVQRVTGYREEAIHIGCALQQMGPSSPKALRSVGTVKRTGRLLADNHYGWFQRVQHGVYALTPEGEAGLGEHPQLRERYLELLRDATAERITPDEPQSPLPPEPPSP
jgi:hypothetical protein